MNKNLLDAGDLPQMKDHENLSLFELTGKYFYTALRWLHNANAKQLLAAGIIYFAVQIISSLVAAIFMGEFR